jgi:hypothetical protein
MTTFNEELQEPKKWVGSGEDVDLSLVEQPKETEEEECIA